MVHPKTIDHPLSSLVAKIPAKYESLMRNVSVIGGTAYVVILLTSLTVWGYLHHDSSLLKLVLLTALFAPLAELSKYITRRKRPETLYAKSMRFKSYSFPSGHSYASALMAGLISVLAITVLGGLLGWLIAISAVVFSFWIGVSRVYLGAHFPTDVLAGWTLGIIITYVIQRIHQGII